MHTPRPNSAWIVLHILSVLVGLFGFAFLIPIGFAIGMNDDGLDAFVKAGLLTSGIGFSLAYLTRVSNKDLRPRDGFLLVALVWLVLALFASLPLYFYFPDLRFSQAFFEGISALTTTGATVLVGLDSMPPSILIWRSLLQWFGGMGIIILAVAILPLLGVGGMQLFKAEFSGPSKDAKLTPRITETAKALWGIYLFLSLCCFTGYWLAGMSWFDALIHTGTTVSIGGLSSHDASLGYFNDPVIEAVAITFMLLSGINFVMHFSALKNRSIRPYLGCPEAKYFLFSVAFGVI
ncbi:MAG: potassium transporter TrkG, partial [Burkholderiaceae bacterium]